MQLAFGWLAIGDGMVLVGDYRCHSVCMCGNGRGLVCMVVMYCDDLCGWGWYTRWGLCSGLVWCILLGLGRVGGGELESVEATCFCYKPNQCF